MTAQRKDNIECSLTIRNRSPRCSLILVTLRKLEEPMS